MMRIGCFAMRKGIFVAREAQIKEKITCLNADD